jgi:hypothetical protein
MYLFFMILFNMYLFSIFICNKKVDKNIIYGHIQLNNINKMEELIRRYVI